MSRSLRAVSILSLRGLVPSALALLMTLVAVPSVAQEPESPFANLEWQPGPRTAEIGDLAHIAVPDGYSFLDRKNTGEILEAMGNIVDGDELGAVFPRADDADWFLVFEFDDVGFVKDDEKEDLDADALLESFRKGTAASNEQRKKRNIPPMEVVGWEHPPSYDQESHNLQWALRFSSEGVPVVNHNTRMLGRSGVMSVILVADPEDLATVLPTAKALLKDFDFNDGERYAEFKAGDKIAEYGLKGLMLGGAAAAAVKFGLFKKFWKLLLVGGAALATAAKKLWARFQGNRDTIAPR